MVIKKIHVRDYLRNGSIDYTNLANDWHIIAFLYFMAIMARL